MDRFRAFSGCPEDAELRSFLSGGVAAERTASLERHLDECPGCAGRVLAMAPAVPRLLRLAARDSALAPHVAELGYQRFRSALLGADGAAPPFENVSEPRPAGTVVGNYRLVDQIGRGGMGEVYRAHQAALDRFVAVKLLSPRFSRSAAAVPRLLAEAKRLAALDHDRIVHAYDAGTDGGVAYYSMELMKGGSLARAIGARCYPPGEAARVMIPIAEAVHAAHRVGVIHRDLKPSNILLTPAGEPKVGDFGLATTRDEMVARGQREIAGTAEYMAPEQWGGDPDLIGPRTDVYGLGTILYELITRRPPYAPEPAAVRQRVLYESPVRPRAIDPAIPRDLEAICLHCLHKSTLDRYPTALDLAQDLRRFVSRRPVAARPGGLKRAVTYWLWRNAGVVASVLAIALVAFGVAGWSLYERRQDARVAQAEGLLESGVRIAGEGRATDGLRDIRRAIEVLPKREAARRAWFDQVEAVWRADSPVSLFEIEHDSSIGLARVSPDGSTVLFADDRGAILLRRAPGGESTELLPRTLVPVRSLTFDATGQFCAAGGLDCRVRVWETATGKLVGQYAHGPFWIRSLAFVGGDRIAIGTAHPKTPLRIWEFSLNRSHDVPTGQSGEVVALAAAPGGAFVAVLSTGRGVLFDRASRSVTEFAASSDTRGATVAFSGDGTRLLVADSSGGLTMRDAANGAVVPPPSGGELLSARALAFAADGSLALSGTSAGKVVVRGTDPERCAWIEIPIGSDPAHFVAANNQFLMLARTGTNRLELLRLPPCGRRAIDLGGPIVLSRLSASADGEHFAFLVRRPGRDAGKDWVLSLRESRTLREVCGDSSTRAPELAAINPSTVALHPTEIALAVSGQPNADENLYAARRTRAGSLRYDSQKSPTTAPHVVVYSPEGSTLFTASEHADALLQSNVLSAWGVSERAFALRETALIPTVIGRLAVAPDSATVAAGGIDGKVRVYAANDLTKPPIEFPVSGPVASLAYAPAGRTIAVGTHRSTVAVFDRGETGFTKRYELTGFRGSIAALRFSPAGDVLFVADGAANAGVAAYNAALGRSVGRPVAVPAAVCDFLVTPHGLIVLGDCGTCFSVPHPLLSAAFTRPALRGPRHLFP